MPYMPWQPDELPAHWASPYVTTLSGPITSQTLLPFRTFDISLAANTAFSMGSPEPYDLGVINPARSINGNFFYMKTTLVVRQTGTGGFTPSFTGITWPGGAAPTPNTNINNVDVYEFTSPDGGATWFGSKLVNGSGSGGGSAGVSSYNNRSGAVTPQASDLTAALNGQTAAQTVTTLGLGAIAALGLGQNVVASSNNLVVGGVYRGAWAANTLYIVGDMVLQNGTLYSANATFTSSSTFSASNWSVVLAPSSGGSSTSAPVAKTGAYTFVAGDASNTIVSGDTAAVIYTVPTGLTLGATYTVEQGAAGQVQFVAGSGMTIRNYSGNTRTAGQYARAQLYIDSASTALLIGTTSA